MARPKASLEELERKHDISKEDLEGPKIDRRTTMKLLSLGGMTALAGCISGDDDSGTTGTDDGGSSGDGTTDENGGGGGQQPQTGGTLEAASATNGFDDLLVWHTLVIEYNAMHNTVNALTILNENAEIVPDVATDWELKNDTTWVYDLRDDVSFHDGYGDVIADDFVWSIERLQETQASPYLPKVTPIKRVEAVDDYRLEIEHEFPFAPWPVYSTRNSNATTLVSQQYMDEVGEDEYTRMPIGTGPFKVDSREEGEVVRCVRHEDYHEVDENGNQLPYLDGVNFNLISEPSTQWNALRSGELHFVRNLPPAITDRVQDSSAASNMTFDPINAGYTLMLSMLCNDPAEHPNWVDWLGGEMTDKWQDQDVPTFNPKVRRAISKAIDREALVEDAYFGYALPSHTPWNPNMVTYEEDIEPEKFPGQFYDPEGAKQLLDEAGYTGDPRFSFSLLAPNDREREMTVIQQQLAEVGIDVTLDIRQPTDYWDAIYSFTNMVSGYAGGAFYDPDEAIRRQLHTPTEEGDGTYQKGLYHNEEFDQLIDQAYKVIDTEERKQLYDEAWSIAAQEAPYAQTVAPQNIMVWRNGVKGFRNPVGATLFDRTWLDE